MMGDEGKVPWSVALQRLWNRVHIESFGVHGHVRRSTGLCCSDGMKLK